MQCTLDLLSIPKKKSLRRDDLMATDMGKLQMKESIMLPIIWEMHWKAFSRDPPSFCKRSWISCISTRTSRWRGLYQDGTSFRKKISLIVSGRLKNRSDFNETLSTLHHLLQESRERQLWPVPFWKYQCWHQSSSSSSSWWQWSDSWWSS